MMFSMTARKRAILAMVLTMFVPATVANGQSAADNVRGKASQVPAGVIHRPDLTYRKTAKGTLELDIAYPAEGNVPLPAVVILHGTGHFSKGRKGNVPLAFELAQRGYVAVSVSYRHTAADAYPAAIDDARAATRWLRINAAQYRIDPKRIAALGYSGGGALACLLGMTEDAADAMHGSSKVQAVVAYYPPTDFAKLYEEAVGGANKVGLLGRLVIPGSLKQWLGGTPAEVKERYAAISPVTHVHKKMAPLLLLHGTADGMVPVEQSRLLADRATAMGASATFLQLAGADHLFDEKNDPNSRMASGVVQTFLEDSLKAEKNFVAQK